jgi:hypothetical protein
VAEPTRAEAERVLQLAKEIGQHVRWTQQPGGKRPRWRLEATVVATDFPIGLRLVGNYGARHWGFALLMNNTPIRRCDFQWTGHRNPDGTMVEQPHKHRWDDVHRDREAYIPDDIDFSDVNRALFDFLKECNITLIGSYQPLIAV